MTDLQKIELELLMEFIGVCNKLNLQYFLVCGSALGAVKYNGFIPWDDDIDVALLRSDYDTFMQEAKKHLPSHIFIQNHKTDTMYPFLFAKLKDSRTTFIEEGLSNLNINHGIYIDVFPIDGYPDVNREQIILEIKKLYYKLQILSAVKINSNMKLGTKLFLKVERFFGCHKRTNTAIEKLTSLLSMYNPNDSAVWCNHGNWQGKLEYASREQYGNGVWTNFEGLKVCIPEKYDEYLTQKYGDWRSDLPKEERVGHHYAKIIDLNHPYTDFIEKLPNGRIRIKSREEVYRNCNRKG